MCMSWCHTFNDLFPFREPPEGLKDKSQFSVLEKWKHWKPEQTPLIMSSCHHLHDALMACHTLRELDICTWSSCHYDVIMSSCHHVITCMMHWRHVTSSGSLTYMVIMSLWCHHVITFMMHWWHVGCDYDVIMSSPAWCTGGMSHPQGAWRTWSPAPRAPPTPWAPSPRPCPSEKGHDDHLAQSSCPAHLENVGLEALLVRVLGDVIVVTQLEDEEAPVVGGDVHDDRDPGAGAVLPHYLTWRSLSSSLSLSGEKCNFGVLKYFCPSY